MKKGFGVMRMVVGVMMMMAGGQVWAQGSDFVLSGDGDTLIKYVGKGGTVTIPSGVKVIGANAFYQAALTGVSIPESVTTIGEYAFAECGGLIGVYIPKGVTTIGMNAFYNCRALSSIHISEGVTTIEGWTFVNTALTSVTIPNSVTAIGNYYGNTSTFYWDMYYDLNFSSSSLTSAIIGDGVTIMDSPFYNCNNLRTLVVGSGMKMMRRQPFANYHRNALEVLYMRCPTPPAILIKDAFVSAADANRHVLHVPEGYADAYRADSNGYAQWATDIIADIPVVYIDTLHDTLTEIREVHDTVVEIREIHDTLTYWRTVVVYDTLVRIDTVIDLRIVHDTLIDLREVHDTTVSEVYVVIDSQTGAEEIARDATESGSPLVVVPAFAYGADMYVFYGLPYDAPLSVYNASGVLVVRADRQPVRLSGKGVFIVRQGGRYWKFVK